MADDRKAVLARVTGRVQGVSFRIWTREQARTLGLSGWVRNEKDGSVTALVVGAGSTVEAMVARLRQGSPAASVVEVTIQAADPSKAPAGFVIRG